MPASSTVRKSRPQAIDKRLKDDPKLRRRLLRMIVQNEDRRKAQRLIPG